MESIFKKTWFRVLVFAFVVGLGSTLFARYSGCNKSDNSTIVNTKQTDSTAR